MSRPAHTRPSERASAPRPKPSDRAILAIAVALALALPGLAWLHLDRRVATDVAPALSSALGAEVGLGGLEAGVTGEIILSDLQVGEIVAIPRIEVAAAFSSLISSRPAIDAIAVYEPRVRVSRGGQSIRELAARARSIAERAGSESQPGDRSSGPAPATQSHGAARDAGPAALLEKLTISGGEVIVDMGPRGHVSFRGLSVAPTPGRSSAVRIAAAAASVELRRGPYRARGRLSRAAADFDLTGPARFLAVGGELEITAEGGAAARLSQVTARLGIEDSHLLIQGKVERAGSDAGSLSSSPGHVARAMAPERPGQLTARIDARRDRVIVDASGERVPLALLAPLLPRSLDVERARGTGALRVTLGETFHVAGDLALRELTIDDRRVAGEAVSLSGRAGLDLVLERAPDVWRIGIQRLELQRGKLVARLTGEAVYDRKSWTPGRASASWLPDHGALSASIPDVECASALDALPRAMRAELEGMDVDGVLTASAQLRFDRTRTEATTLELDIDVDRCRVVREALHDPERLRQPFEHRFPNGSQTIIGRGEKSYVTLCGSLPKAPGRRLRGVRGWQLLPPSRVRRPPDRALAGGQSTRQRDSFAAARR